MWRPRKRSHGEVYGFGRKDSERGRPRCKVDDLQRDSREISPKRRRITDERGGRAWTGGTQGTEDPRPLGYKALEEICNSHSIEDGILDLANKSKRFEALLKSKTEIRPDLMKLVIRAIHLCCSLNDVRKNAERLLRVVVDSDFLCLRLSIFISKMSYYSQLYGNFLPSDLISRLAEIFLELFQRFGQDIVDSIPLAQLSETLRELKDKSLLHEDTQVLEKKILQVREYKDELIRQKIQSARGQEDESQLKPPENYRDISVIPEAEDLKIHNKPFLRVNVVDRSYKDQEHYLDVQFRLLREDFILPLREGIRQLQKENRALGTTGSSHSNHAQDVQVYRDVTVLYPVCSGKGMVYRIRFDAFHHSVRRVKWDKCKLLKFGSLLCLSRSVDGFYSPLFATVENRDPRELCLGELEVRFEGVHLEILNRFVKEKEKFDMVESPAFFESYRHVLEGLQEIEPGELPFHEQIVKCSRDVGAPDYENKTNGFFDMSGIIEDEAEGTPVPQPKPIVDELMLEDHSVVPVTTSRELASVASDSCSIESDDSARPDGNLAKGRPEGFVNIYDLQLGQESLGFNESQIRAFKMALSKRFAVIQGPPGTGKTYVGLKIARVLLQSSMLWQNEQHSPILMVSYTNHALDEFLGGLPTEGIVRVGGRCSDKLKCYSLKVRRKEATANGQTPRRISMALRNVRDELRDLEKDGSLERCTAVLKFSRRGILSFHILKKFMLECHVRWFEREQTHGLDDLLCHWLGIHFLASRESEKKLDRDVSGNEDFQMQVSVRNFSNEEDFEDYDEEKASKPSEVTICTVEDTKNPAGLRRNLQQEFVTSEDGAKRYHDLNQLSVNQRWKLYRFWVQKTENHYLHQLQKKQPDYERALARRFELMLEEDFHVLRKARVIGMTTTCAARYRRTLQRIRPKIVLVEEAAEVLEAHIITSLTKGCQHLILIGDHQQLRPKPAVYELAKKYKLDVSLFERMTKAGIQCERLSVQHRMRPEIAALMKHIYDDLENHESVEKYEDIKGMKKNMFFIDHCHLEYSSDGTHSHVNEHEAKFLVALCRYLLQQGYSSSQITFLTTYTGQMFAIRDCVQAARSEELKQVRLTTVDNFQGEESDIILLSLVRSNEDEKVGFISDVNRACVALSRAKKGLYCIGNFALFSKHSEIWGKIVPDLKKSDSIGNALPFVCQIHHDEMTANTAEDFEQAPDGGCQRPCEVRLECGHACKRLCHPYDTEHLEYRCGEPCAKKIEGCDHDCPKLCYQKCETDCSEVVEKTLPTCGHKQTVRCGKDLKRVQCREQCDKILPKCSHPCQNRCGERCTKQCQELEKRTDWPCGHEVTIACSATQVDCPLPCTATLECNHQCSGKCGECRMGRVHKRCGSSKCDRVLVCSHLCKEPCPMSCPPCSLPCENRCVHAKCKHQCGEACVPCSHKCAWRCAHYLCDKRCGELCNRPRCDKPCNKILKCGSRRYPHRCRGLCGEVCICAVCEKNGTDAITEIFLGGEDEEGALFIQLPDCKHIFAVSDLDRYMDTTDDRREIQLKRCPRCKTVIRRSLRYGNVIKQQLHDIEQVKRKVRGESDEVIQTQEKLQTRLVALKGTFNGEDEMKEWKRLERSVGRMSKGSKTSAVVTENQVTLMERFCALSYKLKENLFSVPRSQVSTQNRLEGVFLQGEMEYLKKRFMSERVTPREIRDINLEFTRLNLQLELCLLEHNITSRNLTLDESSRQVMQDIRKELSSGKLIETEKLDELLERLAAIRESYPCLSPLTSEERKQIVSAMDLSKGHWFKCPKGHIYAIGGCGGAMERSTCPECGAVIGGANHTLQEGNELAPEMDGASHPAWSEQANLQNYVIVDEA